METDGGRLVVDGRGQEPANERSARAREARANPELCELAPGRPQASDQRGTLRLAEAIEKLVVPSLLGAIDVERTH